MKKLLLAILPLSLCGCAALLNLASAAFEKPTLTFRDAKLADVSLGGATVNLTYAVENPNPIGLQLAEVAYLFSVNGKQVVAGSPAKGLSLAAGGRTELVFPAQVKFAELAPALKDFFTKETVAYRAEGSLGIQTPLGVIRLPLVNEGTFAVPKLPTVSVGQPKVTGVTFTGAQVDLPLTVTNRNGFALPIGGLEGALELGGSSVGTLSTGDLGSLDAQGTRSLSLPLKLRFDNAAFAIAGLVGRPVTLGFKGNLRSGAISLPLAFTQTVNFQR